MRVNEIFKSVQGEGPYVGCPSIFIRLSKCNLNCQWCDTRFAIEEEGKLMTKEQVISKIMELDENPKLITITGGEPLLQQQSLVDLFYAIWTRFSGIPDVIIETNGTIRPMEELQDKEPIWSVSPKLGNSGQEVKYNDLSCFNRRDSYFKFVITRNIKDDVSEVVAFVSTKLPFTDNIILQPDGTDKDYIELTQKLVDYCKTNKVPYRIIPQLQRVIWGLRRGV